MRLQISYNFQGAVKNVTWAVKTTSVIYCSPQMTTMSHIKNTCGLCLFLKNTMCSFEISSISRYLMNGSWASTVALSRHLWFSSVQWPTPWVGQCPLECHPCGLRPPGFLHSGIKGSIYDFWGLTFDLVWRKYDRWSGLYAQRRAQMDFRKSRSFTWELR